jgi:hypothetical protein
LASDADADAGEQHWVHRKFHPDCRAIRTGELRAHPVSNIGRQRQRTRDECRSAIAVEPNQSRELAEKRQRILPAGCGGASRHVSYPSFVEDAIDHTHAEQPACRASGFLV